MESLRWPRPPERSLLSPSQCPPQDQPASTTSTPLRRAGVVMMTRHWRRLRAFPIPKVFDRQVTTAQGRGPSGAYSRSGAREIPANHRAGIPSTGPALGLGDRAPLSSTPPRKSTQDRAEKQWKKYSNLLALCPTLVTYATGGVARGVGNLDFYWLQASFAVSRILVWLASVWHATFCAAYVISNGPEALVRQNWEHHGMFHHDRARGSLAFPRGNPERVW